MIIFATVLFLNYATIIKKKLKSVQPVAYIQQTNLLIMVMVYYLCFFFNNTILFLISINYRCSKLKKNFQFRYHVVFLNIINYKFKQKKKIILKRASIPSDSDTIIVNHPSCMYIKASCDIINVL